MKDLDGLPTPDLWKQIQSHAAGAGLREVPETPSRPSASRRARAALVAAVVFGVAGVFAWNAFRALHDVVPAATPRPQTVWQTLRRPLQVPSAAAGACPSSPIVHIKPVGGGFSGPGSVTARGDGPTFVVAEPASSFVHLRPSDRTGGGWYGLKTIFTADPSYRGPMLVRGVQLAGTGGVGFPGAFNAPRPTELHLTTPADSGGIWVSWPTVTYVRSTGCFAYQIDGTTFTEVIVFEARTP
jgi:hypothetical protein